MRVLWIAVAEAKSWCADEIVAHEWGVEVFDASGTKAVPLPPQMHHATDPQALRQAKPVRTLPKDSGLRELPVVFFYSAGVFGDDIPLGFEVGFTNGTASAWYPQADAVRPRLTWDALALKKSVSKPGPAGAPWVETLRGGNALWVSRGSEAERFLFYDGVVTETPAVTIERGPEFRAGRTHIVLRNNSKLAVHDVMYSAGKHTIFAPSIPAGATAGFILEDHVDATPLKTLEARWVDKNQPSPPTTTSWDPCVMMRDPAVAVTTASGYALYTAEVDALLSIWGARLAPADHHPVLVYREDPAALDAAMPAKLYTDMYHWVSWKRLGVVLVDGVRP